MDLSAKSTNNFPDDSVMLFGSRQAISCENASHSRQQQMALCHAGEESQLIDDDLRTILLRSQSLHDATRKATDDIHKDLHAQAHLRELFSPGLTAAKYHKVVRTFHQIYKDVGSLISQLKTETHIKRANYTFSEDRQVGKLYLNQFIEDIELRLSRDCKRLDHELVLYGNDGSTENLAPRSSIPAGFTQKPFEALAAWRYLSEGSRLGNNVIHRQLLKLDWYAKSSASSFYRLRTKEDEAVWQSLIELFNGQINSVNKLDHGAAVIQFDIEAFLRSARYFFALTLLRFNALDT